MRSGFFTFELFFTSFALSAQKQFVVDLSKKGAEIQPNMIWFDNLSLVRTPNYVQQMFGKNMRTHVLSITSEKENITGQDSIYASAIYNEVYCGLKPKALSIMCREIRFMYTN